LLAAYLLDRGLSWRAFFAVLAVGFVIDLLGFLFYPRGSTNGEQARPSLVSALRLRIVVIVAAFLCVYVGIEASVGNWGFSFLTEERGQGVLAAGWVVSAYWLGIALGRLFVNVAAERIGMGVVTLFMICIAVVAVAALVIWAVPSIAVSSVGLAVLGFFLGPVFPTTIAIVPRLVPAELVSTVIGVLAAMSLIGAAALPWAVGASAQRVGLWLLLPWTTACSVLLGLMWWRIARRLR
jgi:fucose permease